MSCDCDTFESFELNMRHCIKIFERQNKLQHEFTWSYSMLWLKIFELAYSMPHIWIIFMIQYDIFEQFILHSPYRDSSPKKCKVPSSHPRYIWLSSCRQMQLVYIKKCPGSYKFFDGSEWHGFFSMQMGVEILKAKKVHPSIIKIAPHGSRGWGG